MTDSPSPILQTREQTTGSNTNLWGGYLVTTQRTTERAAKGYEALAVTGDATISWTNYSATNSGAVARLKLTGTLAAAATLTFPAYQNYVSVQNSAGAQVTIKCSGGTGVAIANGTTVLIYCDGVDYYHAGPTVLPGATTISGALTVAGAIDGVTAATTGTQAVNKTQMEAAIASGAIPAASGAVKVDSAATAGYLYDVLTVSGSLTKTDNGDTMDIGFTFDEGRGVLNAGVLSI